MAVHEKDTVFSVAAISDMLRKTVEGQYSAVRVRGEVSGLTRAASGHVYFTLKDDRAALDAICWRGSATKLGSVLTDGTELTCYGKLTTYAGRSKYQIIVSAAEPAGQGALMALFEQRKQALIKEGLCDISRKRPLPFLPEAIGIITSPTGAVIRDILHRLQDRFPRPVLLWPTAVQGEQAEAHILAAFASITKLAADHAAARTGTTSRPTAILPDVIILARGGGSVEDLWTFNSEHIARAVAACPIPVISAVGHETDTTLVDYVSDVRAPTPTGAAELAVPHRDELYKRIDDHEARCHSAFHARLSQKKAAFSQQHVALAHGKERYFSALRRLPEEYRRYADKYVHLYMQHRRRDLWRIPPADAGVIRYITRQQHKTEQRVQRLQQTIERVYEYKRRRLQHIPQTRTALLAPFERRRAIFSRYSEALHPDILRVIKDKQLALYRASERLVPTLVAVNKRKRLFLDISHMLSPAWERYCKERGQMIAQAERVLKQCSHKAILDKGYAVVRREGFIITRASQLQDNDILDIEFTDGIRSL